MPSEEKQETLIELEVPSGYHEEARLDVYVTRSVQNASRTKVQRGIKEGLVTVNGIVVKRPSHVVQSGDVTAGRWRTAVSTVGRALRRRMARCVSSKRWRHPGRVADTGMIASPPRRLARQEREFYQLAPNV